jgi:predicted Zn-dependent protease with MMP-like domain
MTFRQLLAEAEKTVAATRRKLPPAIRPHAEALPVVYHDWPSEEILADEFEPDILGLFAGDPLGVEPGLGNAAPAQILLFLESIHDYAEGDPEVFREEVRLTYLHELGHYLGWDEEDLEARGLD